MASRTPSLPRGHALAGDQPQRRCTCVGADHRIDVGAAVPGVLGPVGIIDRLLVSVRGLREGPAAFAAPGPDLPPRASQPRAEPPAGASPPGPYEQLVADA